MGSSTISSSIRLSICQHWHPQSVSKLLVRLDAVPGEAPCMLIAEAELEPNPLTSRWHVVQVLDLAMLMQNWGLAPTLDPDHLASLKASSGQAASVSSPDSNSGSSHGLSCHNSSPASKVSSSSHCCGESEDWTHSHRQKVPEPMQHVLLLLVA